MEKSFWDVENEMFYGQQGTSNNVVSKASYRRVYCLL
jgi:hypothetical protein